MKTLSSRIITASHSLSSNVYQTVIKFDKDFSLYNKYNKVIKTNLIITLPRLILFFTTGSFWNVTVVTVQITTFNVSFLIRNYPVIDIQHSLSLQVLNNLNTHTSVNAGRMRHVCFKKPRGVYWCPWPSRRSDNPLLSSTALIQAVFFLVYKRKVQHEREKQ